ncbi:anti-sigma B factor antagonist [Quadrisphaera granulorum]|uniref:Anti-sigma factor antagonist n=1 Tax=Quadrisphaera granulorum TaxID=317664 RepID=A0A316ABD2_9ACTN|nr:STAS domain-containing protein [Quadrisphaera granulorum]PWJ54941.1 anti-sigma B factor antagonist [Quadrisphaera granulorum]SZE95887.1 anti-sigma B factor antagonist [Quadrisphaera granulorum]
MQIAAEQYDRGHFRVVAVSGDIDIYSVPSLKCTLLEALDGLPAPIEHHDDSDAVSPMIDGLVLDLSGVTFIDSSGLGVLVGTHRRARTDGVTVRLAGGSEQVRRLLTITGLVRVMPPFVDVDAATTAPIESGASGQR